MVPGFVVLYHLEIWFWWAMDFSYVFFHQTQTLLCRLMCGKITNSIDPVFRLQNKGHAMFYLGYLTLQGKLWQPSMVISL